MQLPKGPEAIGKRMYAESFVEKQYRRTQFTGRGNGLWQRRLRRDKAEVRRRDQHAAEPFDDDWFCLTND